ncbi:MAG: exo-beta-N-acetylmuramidase NamZ domain-containing protein [Ferruginibacter sp.]
MPIRYLPAGVDAFLENPGTFAAKSWALLTNDAARTTDGLFSRVCLLEKGIRIQCLFSPEHGLNAGGEDGAPQPHQTDALTGLPVISLYGTQWAPAEIQLAAVDGLMVDLPDIGARFYTYLWTLSYAMEACHQTGKHLLILDRANPTGTMLEQAEGPWLDERLSSFIGRWNLPIRHGCTLGELAVFFQQTRFPELPMDVIRVPNYTRRYASISAPFLPTSPAIQTIESALLYPGTCLLEGLTIHEGRGTDYPFQQFGAPWINSDVLIKELTTRALSGVDIIPVSFTSDTSLYNGEICHGIRMIINDVMALRPVTNMFRVLEVLMRQYPSQLGERLYPTAANPSGAGHFSLLTGVPDSYYRLTRSEPFATDIQEEWKAMIQGSLLYS